MHMYYSLVIAFFALPMFNTEAAHKAFTEVPAQETSKKGPADNNFERTAPVFGGTAQRKDEYKYQTNEEILSLADTLVIDGKRISLGDITDTAEKQKAINDALSENTHLARRNIYVISSKKEYSILPDGQSFELIARF